LGTESADLGEVDDDCDCAEHEGAVETTAAGEEVDEDGEFENEPQVARNVNLAFIFCWWVGIAVGVLVLILILILILIPGGILHLVLVLVVGLSNSCGLLCWRWLYVFQLVV
jgi:hypothetical protein